MDYELLTAIIEAFKNYQLSRTEGTKSSLTNFAIWINEQQYLQGQPTDSGHADIIGRNDINVEISKLIVYLNRYSRFLIKKGLVEFPELINEDLSYIYTLMTAESMTKIQLIEKNVHEKPSGLEVIKRLIKHGLIGERDDENDKRSKRVFLTEKGRTLFFKSVENMSKISKIIAGDLTEQEKGTLFTLLKKLENFHNPIFLKEKQTPIHDLLKKIG